MVRKVVIENKCDGCSFIEKTDAQKNILGFIKKPKLSAGWQIVKGNELCSACYEIYQKREKEMWESALAEMNERLNTPKNK